ncbi:MAG: metalloregulator ArsR/SmtB family transcription factor [Pseudomonadota bacterium]|nr:metalloregulator ArsR/SmtB family transcription factor [Pseudomonadota bacterium]
MTYEIAIDALADPRRRAIVGMLRTAPCTVGEIARHQPVSRPAVSQHLKVLVEAGLVGVQPQGTRRYYSLRREGLAELKAWVDGFWDDVLENFAAKVKQEMGERNG